MKLSLAICLLFTTFNSQAALNKWVDAQGKVHYSDSRPADAKTTTIKSLASPESITPASGTAAPKTISERALELKKSNLEKDKAEQRVAVDKENQLIKQKNCESSRSNLAALEHSTRLVTYNSAGERSFLDENSRSQRIEEANKAVSTYCN